MFLKEGLLIITGLAAGSMVAAGIFALIVSVGIFTRLAHRTRTSAYTNLYEDAIVVGGTLANIMFVYQIKLPLYYIGILLVGLFFGIFVGCLAMALAEVLNVFPIFVRRIGLVTGLQYLVLSIAAGKFVGSIIQFVIFR